ncbi:MULTISPECIES: ABC transporter permease [Bacillus]|uniref:ABC transporter permease n=2 Tax=Bacillaceae TaxID=186817 RepID=UPI0007F93891|nr:MULTISPECIES: ABC transporter permease [Bacillus]AVB10019.1 ABC transporter permease [Bacillus velezensis]MCR6615951.1 ABC transporter permease [Bacillus amyloliquefaciens]MCT6684196.1 ABC transporter permease [Bacillus velezensis]MCV2523481.1 ABC transporter permease [Bacillus velezensis]MDQ8057822.1 ABC transporter permease [Bacillus velezensis]
MGKSLFKLCKYDFVVFLREPFFALPILILPGIFFFVFMSIFKEQIGGAENFGPYIPIYSLLISFLVLFFNIGLQYVTEKERGIHKRLIMSSITIYHVILTYIIRGVLISLIGFIEILLVGKLVFHTILTDHMFLFILTFLIVIGITLLFSLSTHNLFKNSRQVLPYTIVMFQYVLFGSGLMFPIESVPEFVKYIVYINPFYHMKNLLLSVWNWQQIINWQGIAYLVLVIFVCICLIYIKSRSKEY